MEIIRHGNKYIVEKVKCKECGCEYGYNILDVFLAFDYIDDKSICEWYVRCPDCGENHHVSRWALHCSGFDCKTQEIEQALKFSEETGCRKFYKLSGQEIICFDVREEE